MVSARSHKYKSSCMKVLIKIPINSPASLVLSGLDNWLLCEKDGLWSSPLAHCLVTCPPPLHVRNVRPPVQRCRSGVQPVGSLCKFRCNQDYHVAGARTNR